MHHVYSKKTGFFTGNAVHTDNVNVDVQDLVKANFGEDFAGITGVTDHQYQKVDLETGQVVPHQPPKPSHNHEWDGQRWQLTTVAVNRQKACADARARVQELEMKVLPRLLRQHALGVDGTRQQIQDLHDEISQCEMIIKDAEAADRAPS